MKKILLIGILAAVSLGDTTTTASNTATIDSLEDLLSDDKDLPFEPYKLYDNTTTIDLSSDIIASTFKSIYKKFSEDNGDYTIIHQYTSEVQGIPTNITVTFSKLRSLDDHYAISVDSSYTGDYLNTTQTAFYEFKCSNIPSYNLFLCLPADCANTIVLPPQPPSHKCEVGYYLAQDLVKYTFYAFRNEQTTQTLIDCYRQTTTQSDLTLGQTCFYAGLKPNNVQSLSDLSAAFINAGYVKNSDGTYTKQTTSLTSTNSTNTTTSANFTDSSTVSP